MSLKTDADMFSKVLRHSSNVCLLLAVVCFAGESWVNRGDTLPQSWPWGTALLLACFIRFVWMVFNLFARLGGAGCYAEQERKAAARIAADEKKRGLDPRAWSIPWPGGRRFGGDSYGLFIQEPDGTRRRDV